MRAHCCICDDVIFLEEDEFYDIEQEITDYVCPECGRVEKKLIEQLHLQEN